MGIEQIQYFQIAVTKNNVSFAEEFNIRGFPSVKFFTGGDVANAVDFDGVSATPVALKTWTLKQLNVLTELKTRDDALQLLGSFAVPFGLSGSYNTVGLELAFGVVYKFLAGFGIYGQLTFSTYFASFVQPMLSLDLGLVFDYEVLP